MAMSNYRQAAAAGDARSLNNLGVMAMRGEGSAVSIADARSYFLQAANAGSASAHYNLALMYDSGMYGHRDLNQAAQEYRIASKMGHAEAQYRLSNLLETGAIPSKSPDEWKQYLNMSIDRGNKEAIARVDGILAPSDVARYLSTENCKECGSAPIASMAARSLDTMKTMAANGDPSAQYNLGVMHLNGNGATQDVSEAARLFTLSARQGYAPAQRQLAQMYLRGDAVGQSKVLAHAWLNLASKTTGAEADAARSEMESLNSQ